MTKYKNDVTVAKIGFKGLIVAAIIAAFGAIIAAGIGKPPSAIQVVPTVTPTQDPLLLFVEPQFSIVQEAMPWDPANGALRSMGDYWTIYAYLYNLKNTGLTGCGLAVLQPSSLPVDPEVDILSAKYWGVTGARGDVVRYAKNIFNEFRSMSTCSELSNPTGDEMYQIP